MIDYKPWYNSKTIWGSIIAIVSVIASVFGVDISTSIQSQLVESALQLVALTGSLIAIFGRLTARDVIE